GSQGAGAVHATSDRRCAVGQSVRRVQITSRTRYLSRTGGVVDDRRRAGTKESRCRFAGVFGGRDVTGGQGREDQRGAGKKKKKEKRIEESDMLRRDVIRIVL
ncbi:hypothetical protein NLK95_28050, partial [Klebsiella pneumoniae]|nr:hypothetical protein [Klebsiella pneumoniae]